MTSMWHDWFLYNDISITASAAFLIAFTVYGSALSLGSERTRFRSLDVLGYLLIAGITCATIASIVWGAIVRYGEPGRSCASDILFRSGRFMLVWLIIQALCLLYILSLIWGKIGKHVTRFF